MSAMNSVNDRLEAADQDGAYSGKTIGYVVENDDPDGPRRIKVKIPNVLDPDQGQVPWCLPTIISPFGQGPDYGVYGSPKIGSPVRVSFQNGDPHYPVYEADEYLKAHINQKFKSPDTWGFKDPGGSELWINMETGAWEFTHQSGTSLKYDADGNLKLHVIKDAETVVDGKKKTTITGDYENTVSGKLNFIVTGNIDIQSSGQVNITSQGTTNIQAQGQVNIQGSQINLN